jgi:hypothetical protein
MLATAVAWKTAKTGCSNNSYACRFNFKIKSLTKIYLYRLNVLSFSFMVVLNGKASEIRNKKTTPVSMVVHPCKEIKKVDFVFLVNLWLVDVRK